MSLKQSKTQQCIPTESAKQAQTDRAVQSILELSSSPSTVQEENAVTVQSFRQASPTAGPSGVQKTKDPGQQKWNPSEEPDTTRREFLKDVDEHSRRIKKLPPAMRGLFTNSKVRPVPVPVSSVPVSDIVDAEDGILPSPERLPLSDVEDSQEVATASPKRPIEEILADMEEMEKHRKIANQAHILQKELADAIADASSNIVSSV